MTLRGLRQLVSRPTFVIVLWRAFYTRCVAPVGHDDDAVVVVVVVVTAVFED